MDYASLPGPPGFWIALGVTSHRPPITQEDVAAWPCSVTILLEITSFLASLHWPHGGGDLGKYGISYFELLIMIELFWGHWLNCEKVIRPHLQAKRPLVGSRILPSDPREIRQGCQFVCSLFRSLNRLPGGFARFIPCQPSAHYARLVHVGWTQCGHGLSSRPRESCDILLVLPLLSFFGYPFRAASELYHGRLKIRYISTPFSRRTPTWPLTSSTSRRHVDEPGGLPGFHVSVNDSNVLRPVKRCLITEKSTAVKRARSTDGTLPTPERWKRLNPAGFQVQGGEDGISPTLFLRLGVG